MRVCGVYFVFVILLSACTNGVSHLDIALQQAKHNKAELEKVLKHFKHDSLKYRAACFLIENMPGKYSILDVYKRQCLGSGNVTCSTGDKVEYVLIPFGLD